MIRLTPGNICHSSTFLAGKNYINLVLLLFASSTADLFSSHSAKGPTIARQIWSTNQWAALQIEAPASSSTSTIYLNSSHLQGITISDTTSHCDAKGADSWSQTRKFPWEHCLSARLHPQAHARAHPVHSVWVNLDGSGCYLRERHQGAGEPCFSDGASVLLLLWQVCKYLVKGCWM